MSTRSFSSVGEYEFILSVKTCSVSAKFPYSYFLTWKIGIRMSNLSQRGRRLNRTLAPSPQSIDFQWLDDRPSECSRQ